MITAYVLTIVFILLVWAFDVLSSRQSLPHVKKVNIRLAQKLAVYLLLRVLMYVIMLFAVFLLIVSESL